MLQRICLKRLINDSKSILRMRAVRLSFVGILVPGIYMAKQGTKIGLADIFGSTIKGWKSGLRCCVAAESANFISKLMALARL